MTFDEALELPNNCPVKLADGKFGLVIRWDERNGKLGIQVPNEDRIRFIDVRRIHLSGDNALIETLEQKMNEFDGKTDEELEAMIDDINDEISSIETDPDNWEEKFSWEDPGTGEPVCTECILAGAGYFVSDLNERRNTIIIELQQRAKEGQANE